MIARNSIFKVESFLANFNAVAILGPRQVGKTTLALNLATSLGPKAVYLDLETPSDLAKQATPRPFLMLTATG
jgi:uncharacterized protein